MSTTGGYFGLLVPEMKRIAGSADEESFRHAAAAKCMKAHFGQTVAEMGFGERTRGGGRGGRAAEVIWTDTQKDALKPHRVRKILRRRERYLALDRVALRNLELTETNRGRSRRGSLLGILDRTRTSMGSRLLRSWIERPLAGQGAPSTAGWTRWRAVMTNPMAAARCGRTAQGVYDVERLLSRIAYDTVTPGTASPCCATLEADAAHQGHGGRVFRAADRRDDGRAGSHGGSDRHARAPSTPDAPLSCARAA